MSRVEQHAVDAVVIGAGVIGLSVAFELGRAERRVLVLERGAAVACGATRASGGMLAPVSEVEFETDELVRLAGDSLRRYPGFIAEIERIGEIDCGYRDEGTLWVALEHDDLAELQHLAGSLAAKQLEAHWLDTDEIHAAEPHLTGRVLGGLRVASDHQVDPRALCLGLERAASRCGCRVETGVVVRAVETADDGRLVVRGVRSDGAPFGVCTPTVVLAAGAWSMHEMTLPIERLSLRPVKGQLVRLRGANLLRHVVRTPHVYIVPRADGQLLIGATMEEMGFDTTPTAGATMDLLRRSWQALPGIYDLELVEVSVGLRSAVDDHLPVVGETNVPGLYLACGHFRNGVLLAPATGHYLARWIVERREPAALSCFAPRRIAGTETAQPV